VADTSGLDRTIVAEDDVNGGGEGGILVELVVMGTHVLGCTRVDNPPIHKVTEPCSAWAWRTSSRMMCKHSMTGAGGGAGMGEG
jgi:hypothetical protein